MKSSMTDDIEVAGFIGAGRGVPADDSHTRDELAVNETPRNDNVSVPGVSSTKPPKSRCRQVHRTPSSCLLRLSTSVKTEPKSRDRGRHRAITRHVRTNVGDVAIERGKQTRAAEGREVVWIVSD